MRVRTRLFSLAKRPSAAELGGGFTLDVVGEGEDDGVLAPEQGFLHLLHPNGVRLQGHKARYVFVVDLVETVGFGSEAGHEDVLEQYLVGGEVDSEEVRRLGKHFKNQFEVLLRKFSTQVLVR